MRVWLALRQQKRRRERNAQTLETPSMLLAPGQADWKLERQGNYAVTTFLSPEPEPFSCWQGLFRAVGDLDWIDAGGDSLSAPLAQIFDPWPQGGVEARVRYTDGEGKPRSDWSVVKQLA